MRFLWRFTWRLVLLALIALTLLQFWFFAYVWYWSVHNPESTAFMRTRLERLREERPERDARSTSGCRTARSRRTSSAPSSRPRTRRSSQHDGFDWEGIRKAYEKNLREGEVVAGGSTITQQLAKNLFLSGERAWWRKAQEAAITVMIELIMDKRRILELYLNVIEWGDGVFGAEAAARHHFGISAAELGARAGGAARRDGAEPAPLRPGRQHGVSAAPHADAARAHERRARSVNGGRLRRDRGRSLV